MVSISSKNNQHLQRAAVNCLDLELCVPFEKHNMTTRKLSDEHIHHLANSEGTTMMQDAQIVSPALCLQSLLIITVCIKAFYTSHTIYIAALHTIKETR